MVLTILITLLAFPSLAGAYDLGMGTGHGSELLILRTPPFQARAWAVRAQLATKDAGTVTGKKPKSVPELDPSAAGAAAVLILGGTLVATGHRRRPGTRLGRDSAQSRPS
jgi:hypothetical protein